MTERGLNGRERHDALEHGRDKRRGNSIVTMTALFLESEKFCPGEFGQVSACRLRRNPGDIGQFGRGERAAIHERGQDVCTSRFANKGSHFGNIQIERRHSKIIPRIWAFATRNPLYYYGENRSDCA